MPNLVRSSCWILLQSALLAGCASDSPSTTSPSNTDSATTQGAGNSSGIDDVVSPFRFDSRRLDSGIDFVHVTGDSSEKPFPAANGSGIAAFDYDQDGRCDLYFATGNPIPIDNSPDDSINRIYRNLGNWTFKEQTAATGLGHNGYTAGIAIGDFDNDGFDDVFLNCFGPDRFYQNQGDGTFLDVTSIAGTNDPRWGTSAVFFDYDTDGFLDLYVGNYAVWSLETNQFCGDRESGHRMFCGPTTVPPEPDSLFRNNGDGTFTDMSEVSGVASTANRAQGVLAADVNLDGLIDLYIGNDLNPNSLLLNRGDGTLENQADLLGCAYDRSGKVQAGMGVTLADTNRDQQFDIFVTNYENEHNAFYEQDSGGFFRETSYMRGLAAPSIPLVGWGTTFADFNLDGWHDVIVMNGHTDDNLAEMGRSGEFRQPPLFFVNNKGQFEVVRNVSGEYFQSVHPGRSLAVADLDNDVDWDLICGHQDEPPELLCNSSERADGKIGMQLQLIGRVADRDGVGAVVRCEIDGRPVLEQVVGGGSYLSTSQRTVLLVVPDTLAESEISLEITWPGARNTSAVLKAREGLVAVIEPNSIDVNECLVLRLTGNQ